MTSPTPARNGNSPKELWEPGGPWASELSHQRVWGERRSEEARELALKASGQLCPQQPESVLAEATQVWQGESDQAS